MKRLYRAMLILALCTSMVYGLGCFAGSDAHAALMTIDFNELSAGTIVTDQYAGQGVLFSAANVLGLSTDLVAGDGGVRQTNNYVYNYVTAQFTSPVDYVSIDMMATPGIGDYHLDVWDTSGNYLTGIIAPVVSSDFMTVSLQVSDFNIGYAVFAGVLMGGSYSGESFTPLLDNLTFRTQDTPPVPEPATMLLVGAGILGLAGFRKRMKK